MGHAQRASHGQVISQSVRSSLLQSTCSVGFHHRSDVLYKLANTRTDITATNSNDHVLWFAGHLVGGDWFPRRSIVSTHMGPLFGASSCHCGREIGVCREFEALGKSCDYSRQMGEEIKKCAKITIKNFLHLP